MIFKNIFDNDTLYLIENIENTIKEIGSIYFQRLLTLYNIIAFNVKKEDILVYGFKDEIEFSNSKIVDVPFIFDINVALNNYFYNDYSDLNIKQFKYFNENSNFKNYNLIFLKQNITYKYNILPQFYNYTPLNLNLEEKTFNVHNDGLYKIKIQNESIIIKQYINQNYEEGNIYLIINPLLLQYYYNFLETMQTPGIFNIDKNIIKIIKKIKQLILNPDGYLLRDILNLALGFGEYNNNESVIEIRYLTNNAFIDSVIIKENTEILKWFNIQASFINFYEPFNMQILGQEENLNDDIYIIVNDKNYDFLKIKANELINARHEYKPFNNLHENLILHKIEHSRIKGFKNFYIFDFDLIKTNPALLNQAIKILKQLYYFIPQKIKIGFKFTTYNE